MLSTSTNSVRVIETFSELRRELVETEQDGAAKKAICVFAGASAKINPIYFDVAKGGGNGGLMGEVARTVHGAGGKVTGIYPYAMRHFGPTEFGCSIQVPDMHSRKKLMAAKCVGFIVLPGGMGTLEELMEMATWDHLGIQSKFIGVLNSNNFYSELEAWLDKLVSEGFLTTTSRTVISIDPSVSELIAQLQNFRQDQIPAMFTWDSEPSQLQP